MADFKANGTTRNESLNVTLVRSFTNKLEPTSELSIRTRLYQEKTNKDDIAREKLRMDAIYYGIDQLEKYACN